MWVGALLVLLLLAGGLAIAIALLVAPEKTVGGLVAVSLVVAVAAGVAAVASSTRSSDDPAASVSFSHAQLEADRVMTQQMAVAVGPGMQAQMSGDGMLERSADEAYLRALEQHTYDVERMLGRVP